MAQDMTQDMTREVPARDAAVGAVVGFHRAYRAALLQQRPRGPHAHRRGPHAAYVLPAAVEQPDR